MLAHMSLRAFRPEIDRNRLITNWVVVHSAELSGERKVARRSGRPSIQNRHFVWLGSLLLILAASVASAAIASGASANGALAKSNKTQTEQAPGTKSSRDSSSNSNGCTGSTLHERLSALPLDSAEVPSLSGFVVKSSSNFGGALIATYICQSGNSENEFTVEWFLESSTWKLKQISRLPGGRPGDF